MLANTRGQSKYQDDMLTIHRMKTYHGILIQAIMKYIRRCNILYIATALLK